MIRIVLETMPYLYRVTITSVVGFKETPIDSRIYHKLGIDAAYAIIDTVRGCSSYIASDPVETPEHT